MQRLTKCIFIVALAACPVLSLSSAALGQQLQWVHRSQQQAPTARTASKPSSVAKQRSQVDVVNMPAKQPTFRQPQQLKQPVGAKPLQTAAAMSEQQAPMLEQATEDPTKQRMAARPAQAYRQARARTPSRSTNQVVRTQHEQMEEIYPQADSAPPAESYELTGSMYIGEVGCGLPEPTCGCAGPCGCGDSGCLVTPGYCEPGCRCEPSCGCEPGCAVGCTDGCFCGDASCGDVCCGDACCEPTCGCGGDGCSDCVHWPQALFGCDDRGCVPVFWLPPIKEFVFFGGVHGFKGPLDRDRDGGNFGFHEGFNIGGKMAWLPWPGLGYQFGYQAAHSQLSGDSSTGNDSSHTQHFVTTGLFHRQPLGLQYGVVWDMLRDERVLSRDYGQVRGQIGFKNCTNREFGLLWTANTNQNEVNRQDFQAADQYLLYYRMYGRQGGDFRGFLGLTDDSNFMLGSDFHLPLNCRWSLEGNFAYLVPEGGEDGTGADEEAWNIGMQLVWHYGNRAKSWNRQPYRPMFNVANNGSLIVVD